MRILLKSFDKMIATLDNHILVDGESQRKFLIREGVVSAEKSRVLGAGSICGANTDRFTPIEGERERQRQALAIPKDKVVVCFMGRLNRDKGVYELMAAVNELTQECPDIFLLLFGNDEEHCMDHLSDYKSLKSGENFLFYGPTSTPQLSLQTADMFCLPSYREGFGMSVIEASCLGLPVICSDAYGLADTMVDNETGLRCKVADVASLKEAIRRLYLNREERERMGQNGRHRVLELFTGQRLVDAWMDFYSTLLDK
jgi:glycosyltransferase involved in cell wall biosynthesis